MRWPPLRGSLVLFQAIIMHSLLLRSFLLHRHPPRPISLHTLCSAFWWSLVSSSQNVGAAMSPLLVATLIDRVELANVPFPLPLIGTATVRGMKLRNLRARIGVQRYSRPGKTSVSGQTVHV